ncbi:MAG TPA: Uma2 family endonuclease [Gemmataceae bacterium]|nr:Uma2 family endonuclease [Gemmataceae bacterium]
MSTPVADAIDEQLLYPDSDGQPMSDNTLQFRWIVTIHGGLAAQYRKVPDVFVAGNLLWYAVKGQPKERGAPDVFVVFGRPKGERGSYKQWVEGGIAPHVTFEVRSPGNTDAIMEDKFEFYDQYGVEEYYIYDPDEVDLKGFLRKDGELQPIEQMDGWVSPLLGIRFDMSGPELVIWNANGERFLTFNELVDENERVLERAEQEQQLAAQERQRAAREQQNAIRAQQNAQQESQRAEQESQRAEQESQRAEQERKLREEARAEVERLAAMLKKLGVDPDQRAS